MAFCPLLCWACVWFGEQCWHERLKSVNREALLETGQGVLTHNQIWPDLEMLELATRPGCWTFGNTSSVYVECLVELSRPWQSPAWPRPDLNRRPVRDPILIRPRTMWLSVYNSRAVFSEGRMDWSLHETADRCMRSKNGLPGLIYPPPPSNTWQWLRLSQSRQPFPVHTIYPSPCGILTDTALCNVLIGPSL